MPPPPTTAKSTAKSFRLTVTANTAKTPVSLRGLAVAVDGGGSRKNSEIKSGGRLTTNRNKLAKRRKTTKRQLS